MPSSITIFLLLSLTSLIELETFYLTISNFLHVMDIANDLNRIQRLFFTHFSRIMLLTELTIYGGKFKLFFCISSRELDWNYCFSSYSGIKIIDLQSMQNVQKKDCQINAYKWMNWISNRYAGMPMYYQITIYVEKRRFAFTEYVRRILSKINKLSL